MNGADDVENIVGTVGAGMQTITVIVTGLLTTTR